MKGSLDTLDLDQIIDGLSKAKRCIIITGAGISVSGGIPDFRSENGLYNLVKAQYPTANLKGRDLFDANLFKDPTSTSLFFSFMAQLKRKTDAASVTRTHHFIDQVSKSTKLLRCYTQNIDDLEARLGLLDPLQDPTLTSKVVQLHGSLASVICSVCSIKVPFTKEHQETFDSGFPSACDACEKKAQVRKAMGKREIPVTSFLRPNIVLYGEHHATGDKIGEIQSHDLKKRPDMLLVIGTSLKIIGVKKYIKEVAKSVKDHKHGLCVFINTTEAPREWDDLFDFQILGKSDDTVDKIWKGVSSKLAKVKKVTPRIDTLFPKTKQSFLTPKSCVDTVEKSDDSLDHPVPVKPSVTVKKENLVKNTSVKNVSVKTKLPIRTIKKVPTSKVGSKENGIKNVLVPTNSL